MIKNIEALIEQLRSLPDETEYVEFKENFSQPEKEAKDISALANSATYHGMAAAYKIWGITDKGHDIVGTTFKPRAKKKGNQDLEIWLRQHLSDNCNFEFNEVSVNEKRLVVLKIWPAFNYPVKYDNIAYIRTGSSTQALVSGSTREAALWQKVQAENLEGQAAIEDLTDKEVLAHLDANRYFELLGLIRPESTEAVMHYLNQEKLILIQDNALFTITNLGAILLAFDLTQFPTVSRKALRIIRYNGPGRASTMKERVFNQGYALSLELAYNYLDGTLPGGEEIEGTRRESATSYPEIAMRELIVNALIHQDLAKTGMGPTVEVFDQKIEITNPGTPLIDIGRIVNDPPLSRNEKLSALMRRFRFCEEAGSGWDKIIAGCDQMKLPAPRIDTRSGYSMRVTLFQAKPFKDLTPQERLDACYWHTCLAYEDGTYATNQSLRERFGIKASNSAQVSRLIREAIEARLIAAVDPNTSPRYMRYKPYWA